MKIFLIFFLASPCISWTLLGPSTSGWVDRSLQFYVNYDTCSIPESLLAPLIDDALARWNGVPTADIELLRFPNAVTTTAEAALSNGHVPLFVCAADFSTKTGAPADSVPAVTVATPDGRMRSALIYLNSESTAEANIAEIDSGKLTAMLSHEIGHALGLGHSSQSEALMYFSIANKPDAVLTQDDMDGITYLYPRNELVYGPLGCASVRSHSHGAPLIFWMALLFGSSTMGAVLVRYSRENSMGTKTSRDAT